MCRRTLWAMDEGDPQRLMRENILKVSERRKDREKLAIQFLSRNSHAVFSNGSYHQKGIV